MAEREIAGYLEADRLALFQAVCEGFQRAEQAVGGTVDRYYTVANKTVCLRFAGPALIPVIEPAIAHLRTEPTDHPAFTICLFDTASTQTRLPLLADSLIQLLRFRWWEHLDNRREIKGYNGARIRAVFHLGPDILSLLDSMTSTAVYWVNDAAQIPYYEKGYPLTTLLNWWLSSQDCYFLHAASFGSASGGVLLPGKGGSGKSTTTLACLNSGLKILGDDYCVISSSTPPLAYSLYNTSKVKTEVDLERFPELRPKMSNLEQLDEEKAMIFLHDHFPGKMMTQTQVRTILVPEISGRPQTLIKPASRSIGFKALAPSTIFQLAGNGRQAFQAMVELVKKVPSYTIELGTEIDQIPIAIEQFLERTAHYQKQDHGQIPLNRS